MIEQIKKQLQNSDSVVSLFLGIAVVVVTTMLVVNYVKGKGEQTAQEAKTQQEQQALDKTLPTTYTVVDGDTLWKISETFFQSGYNWTDIMEANKLSNADMIEAGQTLTIPKVAKREPVGQVSSATVEVKKPDGGKYTVAHGDTLWNIAEKTYGTGFRWGEIAALNKLDNANTIHAGNVLDLP